MKENMLLFLPIFAHHLVYKTDQPLVPTWWENILDNYIDAYTKHVTRKEAQAAVASHLMLPTTCFIDEYSIHM
jgi:hypothetical protein